jgi:ubiquinone/menaquinone biosynthesis C-methylase UbiE
MRHGADRPLALTFGRVAATYDRVRPRYFLPLLDRAQDVLELGPGACVLDLGAGTGRLTRELVERFETVIAVEPDEEMRAFLGLGTAVSGSAEAIPLTDTCMDVVFVGEAFHWFDPARALNEIARVLRPRGALAIIWTHWWETNPPLPKSAIELLRRAYERTAQQRTAQHRRPDWDEVFRGSPFEPLRKEPFEEEITVDADGLLALYSTTSGLASLSQSEREALFANVRPHLAGPYRLPIKHELNWTRLA